MTESTGGGSSRFDRAPPLRMPSAPGLRAPRPLRATLVAAACALLAGCGGPRLAPPEDASAPAAGTPVVATTPAPRASPIPSLGEIVWATSADPATNAPQEPLTSFAPEAPRIAAFVLANALPAGATIAADWEYNDTSLDAFSRQIVVPTPTDQTWMSFHIDRGDAETWPVGTYGVAISLDGQVVREAAVEVVPQA